MTSETRTEPTVYTLETVPVEGGNVVVRRGGSGPPLLFLQSWISGPRSFHELLAERFDVIAPDHPGFGASDRPPWLDGIDDLVYHELELLDRFELEAVDVVGESLGGWIAVELAVHSPERVRRLVLIDSVGLELPEHPLADVFAMNPEELRAAVFHDRSVAEAVIPVEPDIDAQMQMYNDLSTYARVAWNPFCCNPKLERRLHRVAAPTLVLWGDDDRIVPIEHGRGYAERLPSAELRVIVDSGHLPTLERPAAAIEAIVDFLGRPG